MKFIKSYFSIGIITLFINSLIFAQQTSSFSGQVTDALGAVVVGANVIAVAATARKKRRRQISAANLQSAVSRPELISVRVSAPQFAFYEKRRSRLRAGSGRFERRLTVEGLEEQVDVRRQRSFQPTRTIMPARPFWERRS
jgi:hypothetical protein